MQFTNKETVDIGGAGRPDPGWHGKSLEGRKEAAVQIRPEGEAQATPTPAEGTPIGNHCRTASSGRWKERSGGKKKSRGAVDG